MEKRDYGRNRQYKEDPEEYLKWVKSRCEVFDDCWIWPSTNPEGYGIIQYDGRIRRIHRHICVLIKGRKKGLVRHLCNVRACCNPEHLEWGTQRQNMNDPGRRRPRQNSTSIYKPRGLPNHKLVEWVESVSFKNEKGCWFYPGSKIQGYSTLHIDGHKLFLHRYVCALVNGKSYKDRSWVARHTCHRRSCVNPSHLIPGSYRDNSIDSRESSRSSKLSMVLVKTLRMEWDRTDSKKGIGEFCREQEKIYGVPWKAIYNAIRMKTWT